MSDLFTTAVDSLAGFGITLSAPRTRSTIGKETLALLTQQGSRVFVFSSASHVDTLATLAKTAESAGLSMLRESEKGSASVRSNITNAAKSRKVKIVCSALKDADDNVIGYDVLRTA